MIQKYMHVLVNKYFLLKIIHTCTKTFKVVNEHLYTKKILEPITNQACNSK